MTHFQFFVACIFIKAMMPRFVPKMNLNFYKETDKEIDVSKVFQCIVLTIFEYYVYWLGSGYILPYFNKYVPL